MIGKRLRALMQERELSARQIAEMSGVSPANVSNWLLNKNRPTFKKIKRLADALGVSVGYFDDAKESEKREAMLNPGLTFSQSGIEVNLTASKKSLKERVRAFVDRVAEDLEFIASQKHEAEVLVEYRKVLNAVQAVTIVSKRYQELEKERERARLAYEARVAREAAARKVEEALRLQAAETAGAAAGATEASSASDVTGAAGAAETEVSPPIGSIGIAPPLTSPIEIPIAPSHEPRLTAKFRIKSARLS